jgi:hypothetical protein
MIWIARDLGGFSFSHLYDKTAGIRAVIGANRAPDLFEHQNLLIQIHLELLYHFSLLKNEFQKPKKLKESP